MIIRCWFNYWTFHCTSSPCRSVPKVRWRFCGKTWCFHHDCSYGTGLSLKKNTYTAIYMIGRGHCKGIKYNGRSNNRTKPQIVARNCWAQIILVWNDQKVFIKNREEFLNKPTFALCQLVRLTIRERLKISWTLSHAYLDLMLEIKVNKLLTCQKCKYWFY